MAEKLKAKEFSKKSEILNDVDLDQKIWKIIQEEQNTLEKNKNNKKVHLQAPPRRDEVLNYLERTRNKSTIDSQIIRGENNLSSGTHSP
jgi:hypothetical protein